MISLKSPTRPPGDMTDVEMDRVARPRRSVFARPDPRDARSESAVCGREQRDLFDVWKALKAIDLATPNIGTLTDMICCPGLDLCSLANATTIPIAKQINERFDNLDYLYDLGTSS